MIDEDNTNFLIVTLYSYERESQIGKKVNFHEPKSTININIEDKQTREKNISILIKHESCL